MQLVITLYHNYNYYGHLKVIISGQPGYPAPGITPVQLIVPSYNSPPPSPPVM